MPQNPVKSTLFVSKIVPPPAMSVNPAEGTGIVTLGAQVNVFATATAPVNGTSGTLVGTAAPGDLLAYTSAGSISLYQNTNTKASPTWSIFEAGGGSGNFDSLTVTSGASISGGMVVSGGFSTPPNTNQLALTAAKSDAGVGLVASATGGAMGVSRSAGASLVLAGETASSGTKTDKALWEFALPESYISGGTAAVLSFSVDQQVAGSGTFTGSTTVLTPVVYSEVNGVETALTVSPSSAGMTSSASELAFVASGGTALAPGAKLTLEVAATVVNTAGTNSAQINGASYQA